MRAEGGQLTGEGRQAYQGSASQGRRGSRAVVGGEARLALSHQLGALRAVAHAWKGYHSASCFHGLCHQPCLSLRVDVPHGKGSQEVSTLPLDPVLGSGENSAENCLG